MDLSEDCEGAAGGEVLRVGVREGVSGDEEGDEEGGDRGFGLACKSFVLGLGSCYFVMESFSFLGL